MKTKTDYTPKTCAKRGQRNKLHPVAIALSKLFVEALSSNPPLPTTAWCIELAKTAITSELIAHAEKKSDIYAENMIRQKIERDKGVKIT